MKLTEENYFSKEMNKKYMSASQLKDFLKCPKMAMAKINGEYEREVNISLLIGSYIDAYFEGTLDLFKSKNPELFKKDGTLKSQYIKANEIIKRIEEDSEFMKYMSGKKQVIMVGEIEGVPFKIKIDSYFKNLCITDLKIIKNLQLIWNDELKIKENFVEHWGYDIQGSIYQKIEGNNLPFILAVATKESETDIELLKIPQDRLDYVLENIIKPNVRHFQDIKEGKIEPIGCGKCDYCKSIKKLTGVIDYRELWG